MKCLIIVAHGSRKTESNDEIHQLAKRLQSESNTFTLVMASFLELAEPSIPDGIQYCIDLGATEILVLPYFLSAGRHVSEDVPALVHQKRLEHPDVSIKMATYLGAAEGLPNLVLETAKKIQCNQCSAQSLCQYPGCVVPEK